MHGVGEIVLKALEDAVAQAPTPEAKLRAFLRARVTEVHQVLRDTPVSEDAAIEVLPMARQIRKVHVERQLELLAQVLREGEQDGTLRVARPEVLAAGIDVLLRAIDLEAFRQDWLVGSSAAGVDDLLEVLVRGLRPGDIQEQEAGGWPLA